MSINIYVYWGARRKDAEELVPQFQAHFRALDEADDRFARWAPRGRSLKKAIASKPVNTSSCEVLHRWLLKGRNKTDMPPRQPVPELGYNVSLWNQRQANIEASTSVHCGSFSKYLSEDSQNNASLEFSYKAGAEPVNTKVLLGLFLKFIDIWEPSWGSIWRHVHEGHPAGARWNPRHVQYAFFQSPGGRGHDERFMGQQQTLPKGGRLWTDETAVPFLEET
ncbi:MULTISPECIES: Imm52 family immunity protein [unclassified Mesorhizobium]|uniref:Imm52 family immunity protein n=1 Tax=unclassified Mesorhizobium TaxID=325217 RepID=UPI00333A90B5